MKATIVATLEHEYYLRKIKGLNSLENQKIKSNQFLKFEHVEIGNFFELYYVLSQPQKFFLLCAVDPSPCTP